MPISKWPPLTSTTSRSQTAPLIKRGNGMRTVAVSEQGSGSVWPALPAMRPASPIAAPLLPPPPPRPAAAAGTDPCPDSLFAQATHHTTAANIQAAARVPQLMLGVMPRIVLYRKPPSPRPQTTDAGSGTWDRFANPDDSKML